MHANWRWSFGLEMDRENEFYVDGLMADVQNENNTANVNYSARVIGILLSLQDSIGRSYVVGGQIISNCVSPAAEQRASALLPLISDEFAEFALVVSSDHPLRHLPISKARYSKCVDTRFYRQGDHRNSE